MQMFHTGVTEHLWATASVQNLVYWYIVLIYLCCYSMISVSNDACEGSSIFQQSAKHIFKNFEIESVILCASKH